MKISMWKTLSYVCAAAVLTTMAVAAKDVRNISIRDECDPATFNAALQDPNACVGDGDVTFTEFLDALADGGHEKWRFNNDRTETDGAVNSTNRGGETHTFTEVKQFGGGFVPAINMGLAPIRECVNLETGSPLPGPNGTFVPGADALNSFVAPGASSETKTLSRGTHLFQCCIHPWMKSTVVRR
jgi:hypothetical protein